MLLALLLIFNFKKLYQEITTSLLLKDERDHQEVKNILRNLHDLMMESSWIRVIEPIAPKELPEDIFNPNLHYSINSERVSVSREISTFLAILVSVNGNPQKAAYWRNLGHRYHPVY